MTFSPRLTTLRNTGMLAAGLGALVLVGCSSVTTDPNNAGRADAETNANSTAGSLNPNFKQNGRGLNEPVDDVAVKADGETLIVGGRFTEYSGDDDATYVVQIKGDGSVDTKFSSKKGALNNRVRAVAQAAKDGVFVGGDFTQYGSTAAPHLALLKKNGSLNKKFSAPALNNAVWEINPQSNGQVLIGGLFNSKADGLPKNFARLNADGSVDKTFSSAGLNGYVKTSAVQRDGKILIGGSFSSPTKNLARLNSDGTLDKTFQAQTTAWDVNVDVVDDIVVLDDGKILVAGNFTTYDGQKAPRIMRLQANGTLDTTFTPGEGFNDHVKSIVVQNSGMIVAGGNFKYADGNYVESVARLNADGVYDPTFRQVGKGLVSSSVSTLALTDSQNIAVGGSFFVYNTTAMSNLTELLGN